MGANRASLPSLRMPLDQAWGRHRRCPVDDPCTERSPSVSLREVLLLPYPTVDAFAQQIGVPAVSCVLFDAVDPQLPDGDAVLPHPLA